MLYKFWLTNTFLTQSGTVSGLKGYNRLPQNNKSG